MYNSFNNTLTGPGGTKYQVVAKTQHGVIGFAELGSGQVRVRVEPLNGAQISLPGSWAQPVSNNNRFSIVVNSDQASASVLQARKALAAAVVPTVGQKIQAALSAAGF